MCGLRLQQPHMVSDVAGVSSSRHRVHCLHEGLDTAAAIASNSSSSFPPSCRSSVNLVSGVTLCSALLLLLRSSPKLACLKELFVATPSSPPQSHSLSPSSLQGLFMCLTCSGIHRSLGVHISQVGCCSGETHRDSTRPHLQQQAMVVTPQMSTPLPTPNPPRSAPATWTRGCPSRLSLCGTWAT